MEKDRTVMKTFVTALLIGTAALLGSAGITTRRPPTRP